LMLLLSCCVDEGSAIFNIPLLQTCCDGATPGTKICYDNEYPFNTEIFIPRCFEDIHPVTMEVFTRKNSTEGQLITRHDIPKNFDKTKETKILVHGWINGWHETFYRLMKDTLLEAGDFNVMVTMWEGASYNINYFQSAADTRTIGTEIALVIGNLIDKLGMSRTQFHCIGHSLGGQVCGFAGMYSNKTKPGRITGLDPAGPDFENRNEGARLNPNCADFVDVIHTNAFGSTILNLGIAKPSGHVDFYVNGALSQPECQPNTAQITVESFLSRQFITEVNWLTGGLDDFVGMCSHCSSFRFWTESLLTDCFYSRQQCKNYKDLPGSCLNATAEPIQAMGLSAIKYPARGIFYLTTNETTPFCKG